MWRGRLRLECQARPQHQIWCSRPQLDRVKILLILLFVPCDSRPSPLGVVNFERRRFTNDGVTIRVAGNSKVIHLSLMLRRVVSFGNRVGLVSLMRTVPAIVLWLALWGYAFWLPYLVEPSPRRTSAHGTRFCITRLARHRTAYSGRYGPPSIL